MNILFITADQWRGECLSCLDHPQVKTPALDRLAAEGVLFKQHYAQAAPCAPSRTSLHTGLYMQNHRCVVNGTPVDARLTNWALEVRHAGYDASLFGYTDTAVDPRGLAAADPRLLHYSEPLPGIGHYTSIVNDVSQAWVESLRHKGYALPPVRYDLYGQKAAGVEYAQGGEYPLPSAIAAADHETHFMVDKCIEWIQVQTKPWITHLSLLRPHPPFVAPAPYHTWVNPATLPPPLRTLDRQQQGAQHGFLQYMLSQPKYAAPSDDRVLAQQMASYYGLMGEVDDNLGRLFECLRALGQWDDTLIIFTSDHGEQMGDHWLFGKLGFYDQSYFIPLIIRDPRRNADPARGQRLDVFTENVDLMPTMLDWLGLNIPSQCDGRSLLPLLRSGQPPPNWRDAVHWEYDFRDVLNPSVERNFGLSAHQCGLNVIRDDEFKYVHFTALPPLLFDLGKDPQENVNRATDKAYQSVLLHYAQKLLSWRMNHAERALTETFLSAEGMQSRRAPLYPVE